MKYLKDDFEHECTFNRNLRYLKFTPKQRWYLVHVHHNLKPFFGGVGTVLVWNQIHFASVMADVKDI